MATSPQFIHLSVHTEYSLVDSTIRIKSLIKKLTELKMPAVAITDYGNLFGAVKFYQAAEAAGIKPILGADVQVVLNPADAHVYRFTVLSQNNQGFLHLKELLSQAYRTQLQDKPLLLMDWLLKKSSGLIILAGRESVIGQTLLAGHSEEAKSHLDVLKSHFEDRLYLEIQRTGRAHEAHFIENCVDFADTHQVPVVATGDVRFLTAEDFEAHEARVCIQDGFVLSDPNRPKLYSQEQYVRSEAEMVELFADLPQALQNSVEIAKRCNVTLEIGKNHLPNFPVPAGFTSETFLTQEAQVGLLVRLQHIQEQDKEAYQARLLDELKVINQMGFAGYFLIVADFIRWAKEQDIPVGPGRGSGAGSIVAYALSITDLDPIQHDLLFERFLNPERISMPDFDVDFCMEGRDRVIDYVAKRYGRESVSQIITFGSMAAKAVVRDVGRVLSHPYGFVDKIAKLIPFELGMTLEKALDSEPLLKNRFNDEDEVRELIELAMKLEGLARNAGKHAGGVVIAPTVLTDFAPTYCESGSQQLLTQWDKDDVETVGLIKFDFLGLRTLTIIHWALQTLRQQGVNVPDFNHLPPTDEAVYTLLKSCYTTAIFQLESRGMKDLIRRLQPDRFEDIVALVALFRPGPLQSGMVDDFIQRKHGEAVVDYPHPLLEPILKPTYGVILYQEQVMQIAQVLAGYSLGQADLLRRAMGKKKAAEMAKHRAMFLKGASQRDVAADVANHIFDLMEKFADYGFNKSHSAAYAVLTYQTAWLKAHYPAAFMAAVLTSEISDTDKIVTLMEECKRMTLVVLPPTVNDSQYAFTVVSDTVVRFGLGAIKGVGENLVTHILEERVKQGPFSDLFSFCKRVDLKKMNRRAFEALIRSGAMDTLGPHRAALFHHLDDAIKVAQQYNETLQSGQKQLFAFAATPVNVPSEITWREIPVWHLEETLTGERDTLGFYLSGHPIQPFAEELRSLGVVPLSQLASLEQKMTLSAGLVASVRTLLTKRKDKMAIVTLDDGQERMDVTVFSDLYTSAYEKLQSGQIVLVEGEIGIDDFTGRHRLTGKRLWTLEEARAQFAKGIVLTCNITSFTENLLNHLKALLANLPRGSCRVFVEHCEVEHKTLLQLGDEWQIVPSQQALQQLQHLLGANNVRVNYQMSGA